jgi:hypothetical protein
MEEAKGSNSLTSAPITTGQDRISTRAVRADLPVRLVGAKMGRRTAPPTIPDRAIGSGVTAAERTQGRRGLDMDRVLGERSKGQQPLAGPWWTSYIPTTCSKSLCAPA